MQKALVNKNILSRLINSRWITSSTILRKDVDMVDIPDQSLPIPNYKHKENETLELRKARLVYQSRKRGMLENGLLLSTFAARYLKDMNADQVILYDNLINQPTNDWDIFYWATNVKPTPDEYNNEIMDMLKKHVGNEKREQRIRQPGLYDSV